MSASRDQSQKIAFVYSNLYQLYQKGKTAAKGSETPVAETPVVAPKAKLGGSTNVLKTDDLHKPEKVSPKVSSYSPAELIGKRVARPESVAAKGVGSRAAISSLKDNLKALNELHSRLRFMLQELEDLVKE